MTSIKSLQLLALVEIPWHANSDCNVGIPYQLYLPTKSMECGEIPWKKPPDLESQGLDVLRELSTLPVHADVPWARKGWVMEIWMSVSCFRLNLWEIGS